MFWQLRETVVLAEGTTVEVSTVDLSLPEYGIVNKGYETALIYGSGDEEIEIVEWYATKEQAQEGHAAWSRKSVIEYVIKSLQKV